MSACFFVRRVQWINGETTIACSLGSSRIGGIRCRGNGSDRWSFFAAESRPRRLTNSGLHLFEHPNKRFNDWGAVRETLIFGGSGNHWQKMEVRHLHCGSKRADVVPDSEFDTC